MPHTQSEKSNSIAQKLKEVFKHSIVYGLTSSLQSLLGFVLLPILTIYYTPAIFGAYSIILLVSAFSSAIFYLGASSALGRFYYNEDSNEYRRKIVSTALLITIIGAVLLVGLALIFSTYLSQLLFKSPQYSSHIFLSLCATATGFLLTLMTLILRYEKKSFIYLIVTIAGVLINFIITYILLVRFKMGIFAPIYGLLIANSASFLTLFILHYKSITLILEKQHFYLLLNFGIQIALSSLLFYILQWVDQLIINNLLDLSNVGIYSLGVKIGNVLNVLIILPFSLIWAPMRMEYSSNDNNDKFITKIISYYSIAGLAIIFVCLLFSDEIMAIFFKNKEYIAAGKIFPFIMLSLLFGGYQNIIDYGIYLHQKLYYYSIIAIIAICIKITFNYLLIPYFGYMAAAYISVFTGFFSSFLIYLASNKYHPIKIEWKRIGLPIILLFLCYYLINIEYNSYYVKFMIKGVLLVLSFLYFYKIWLDSTERVVLKNSVNHFVSTKI